MNRYTAFTLRSANLGELSAFAVDLQLTAPACTAQTSSAPAPAHPPGDRARRNDALHSDTPPALSAHAHRAAHARIQTTAALDTRRRGRRPQPASAS